MTSAAVAALIMGPAACSTTTQEVTAPAVASACESDEGVTVVVDASALEDADDASATWCVLSDRGPGELPRLFHGADGSGAVVLALPEVRLPAPFTHVVMFGPVTTGGPWDAAASALPIALVILLFGFLNAVFDVARLERRERRADLAAHEHRAREHRARELDGHLDEDRQTGAAPHDRLLAPVDGRRSVSRSWRRATRATSGPDRSRSPGRGSRG